MDSLKTSSWVPPLDGRSGTLGCVGLALLLLGGCAIDRSREVEIAEPIDPGTISEVRDLIEGTHGTILPDCDGNGISDLIETGPTHFGFVRETGPFPVDMIPRQPLSADLDGDMRAEIMSLNHPSADIDDGSLSVVWDDWIEADDRRSDSVPLWESAYVRQAIAGDFTENGSSDVVVLYEQLEIRGVSHYEVPKLVVLRNAGDGALVHRRFTDEYTLGNWRDDAYRMVAADYDGDRDIDLFVTWKDGSETTYGRGYKVALFTNRSDRADGDLFDVRSGISTFYDFNGAIATAHLDEDSDLEVLVPYAGGTRGGCTPPVCCATRACLAVLTPSWGDRWEVIHLDMGDDAVRDVAAADLDRDGRADLVIWREDSNELQVLLNVGTGEVSDDAAIFGDPVAYAMGDDVRSFLLTDLNGNGDPDLVAVNGTDDQVTVRLGLGDGNFSRPASYATGPAPRKVATARLARGEFPALVIATTGDDSLDVLRNTTVAATALDCNRNRKPDTCDIEDGTSMDRNRDGIPDECPTLRPLEPTGPLGGPPPL